MAGNREFSGDKRAAMRGRRAGRPIARLSQALALAIRRRQPQVTDTPALSASGVPRVGEPDGIGPEFR